MKSRYRAVAAAAVVVGCARTEPPRPSPALPGAHERRPAPTAAAPEPAAPASAAPVLATPVVPPLPAVGDPLAREKLMLLSGICRLALGRGDDKQWRVGCMTPPPFDKGEAMPNGRIQLDPAEEDMTELRMLWYGSFTRPGADEAVARFEYYWHAPAYGPAMLANRADGRWSAARYYDDFRPERCTTYRRADARDVLVCSGGAVAQGYAHSSVFVSDFTESTRDRRDRAVLEITDDSQSSCFGGPRQGELVRAGQIDGFELRGVGREQHLFVTVSIAKGRPTKRYFALCQEAERTDVFSIRDHVSKALGKRRRLELEYVYDGTTFAPTARTAMLAREL